MPTKKNIESPEKMYQLFEEYKKACKAQPKKENFWDFKKGEEYGVSREVPLTWKGFEVFCWKKGVVADLGDYERDKDGRYSEYATIITRIKTEIYDDKFSGAVAGIYNHNIIARDLGLSDKKEVELDTKKDFTIKIVKKDE